MITLGRARLALICAAGFAVGTLVFELPVSELMHRRGELSSLSGQLSIVAGRNAELASEVASLHQNTTIAAIAHADYGLVRPGQRSYVVLPTTTPSPGAATSLAQPTVPASDLVPVDPSLLANGTPSAIGSSDPVAAHSSLFTRTVTRLEFWRWAF